MIRGTGAEGQRPGAVIDTRRDREVDPQSPRGSEQRRELRVVDEDLTVDVHAERVLDDDVEQLRRGEARDVGQCLRPSDGTSTIVVAGISTAVPVRIPRGQPNATRRSMRPSGAT